MTKPLSATVKGRPGPPPSLEVDEILQAALRILDRDGAGKFSMRNLAAELGTSTMTVYNYFDTKGHLLEAVVDSVLSAIKPPLLVQGGWEAELRRYARSAWRVQSRHAWLPVILVEHQVSERPAQRQGRAGLLQLFLDAGADLKLARSAVAVFFSFMIGSFMQIQHAPAATRKISPRADALFESGLDILVKGLQAELYESMGATAPPLAR